MPSHLLTVVARLVGVNILVLVGAGPLGGRVLDASLVLPLGHGDADVVMRERIFSRNYEGAKCRVLILRRYYYNIATLRQTAPHPEAF